MFCFWTIFAPFVQFFYSLGRNEHGSLNKSEVSVPFIQCVCVEDDKKSNLKQIYYLCSNVVRIFDYTFLLISINEKPD